MSSPRTRHRPRSELTNAAPAAARSWALIVLDQRPFQQEAWAEFHAARKRGEKATRELARHEAVDTPAFLLGSRAPFRS